MSDDRQEFDGRFKLILAATAFVHLLLLGGLVFISLSQHSNREENIVWVNPGSFGNNQGTGKIASAGTPQLTSTPSADSGETGPPETEKPPKTSPLESTPALSTPSALTRPAPIVSAAD